MLVTLREITAANLKEVLALDVAPGQEEMVAPNAVSIAEAHFEPKAWFRAIYSDETAVGFVMLLDDSDKEFYYLWRMMIAADQQGKGYGRRALDLLVDYVRERPGASELKVSCVPGEGGPQAFYEGYGFESTGEIHDGELVLSLPLAP